MRKLFPLAAAVVIGATLISCGGGGDVTPPPVLTTLNVTFPAGAIAVGQSAAVSAAGFDQHGASIATGTISWTSDNAAVATIDANGLVLGVGAGQTLIRADASGKKAQVLVTVILPPVASVTVLPPTVTLVVGENRQFLATTFDASGNVLTGRVVTWATSDVSKATVSSTGMVGAVAAGPVTITATSETKSGTSQVTVNSGTQVNCSPGLQISVGQLHTLTSAERTSLCLGGGASTTEYVLIPFNNSNVAASQIPIQITGSNTAAIQPGQLASIQPSPAMMAGFKKGLSQDANEFAFRERELHDLAPVLARSKRTQSTAQVPGVSYLTGIPLNPSVGSVVQINASVSGNTCTSTKQLHDATVAAVLPHTLVLVDNTSPPNGYTPAELAAFGQSFESDGYPLDVLNFGTPSDRDSNGRIAILFTPAVNAIPVAGGIVLGLFAARDLYDATTAECVASNEGEMFYLPVPDPASTINNKYTDKTALTNTVLATLVHEFQHLINAGRRKYVNTGAAPFEDLWLNEGLSHIAEELLYYHESGNPPRTNIDLVLLRSSQAQLNAVNTYQLNNLARLSTYMQSPELNSPFAQVDGFQMRGAIWQLLRYSADRKGGSEQSTWFALVNSPFAGQQNFNSVFGDIITSTRDWAIAQFADDAGLGLGANYSHPSWNFRSVLPAINGNTFPLLTHALLSTPLDITLNGGGAAYVRFSVAASVPATITTTSSGQPVPASVDFILLRTQ